MNEQEQCNDANWQLCRQHRSFHYT